MAETTYTPRLDLPYAIERGRSQVLTLSVYSGATLTAPRSGTLTLYTPDGTSASTGAVSIVSDVAEYTVSGLTSHPYGDGWAVEWALVMPDGVTHTYRSDAALCRVAPQQTVCPADLYRLQPYLDASSTGAISSETWVDQCREAYIELQRRLWSRGRPPRHRLERCGDTLPDGLDSYGGQGPLHVPRPVDPSHTQAGRAAVSSALSIAPSPSRSYRTVTRFHARPLSAW